MERAWTCQVITVNAKESQEPEPLPAVDQEHCVSQRWSIAHLLLSAAGPLPRGPVVGLALAAPLFYFIESGGVGLGLSGFQLQSGWCWSEPLTGSGTVWAMGSTVSFISLVNCNFLKLETKYGSTPFLNVTDAGADEDPSNLYPWLSILTIATEVGLPGELCRAREIPLLQGRHTRILNSGNPWPISMTLPWSLGLGSNPSLWNPLSWGRM